MNTYLIVAGDFVDHGGMDRANLELARYVQARGHFVHLVAHRVSRSLANTPGVRIHHVPRPFRLGLIGERGLDFVGRRVAATLPQGTRIVVNGGNCAIDAVNWIHFVHRVAESVASTGSLRSRTRYSLARWSEARAIGKARLVVANSAKTRNDLEKAFVPPPAHIRTVYCGIDSTRFFPANSGERDSYARNLGFEPNRGRLAFVGALGNENKGFDTLFAAWQTIAHEWPTFEVVVIGAGRMLPKLIRRARRAKLDHRLHFLGRRADVADILKASDVLVAPSHYESYGLNIAEALATGLPVIASVNSGASELVRGDLRRLLLADPRSAAELVAKLRDWREGMALYRQAALEASPGIRAHGWDEMSSEVYRLVEGAYT